MHLISNYILLLLIIMAHQINYSVTVDQSTLHKIVGTKIVEENDTLKVQNNDLKKEKMICC